MAYNYSDYSTDELNKIKAQNSQSWWDLENSQNDGYKQQQDNLHQQNLDIVSELDRRNNTATTYNAAQGTYNSKGNQALDTSSTNSLYNSANNALSSNLANKPTDNSTKYNPMLDDLYNQIVNRGKFSYNLNEDALYQQYADQYARNGKLAMQDTIGQTAALTGGYGSTYAQNAGQQAYNSYMQQLNDIVPELEQRAYDRWQDEGNNLLTQWNLLDDRLNTEYGKYTDALNNYWTGNNFYANRADQYYNQAWNEDDRAYDREQTENSNLASQAKNLMGNGLSITYEQGKAWGMTDEQIDEYNNSLLPQTTSGSYYYPSNNNEEDDNIGNPGLVKGTGKTEQSVIDSINYADKNLTDENAKKSAICKIVYNSVGLDRMTPEDADKYLSMYNIDDDYFESHKG